MMNGGYGYFTQYELWSILTNLNKLKINTISIQKTNDFEFVCVVDNPTIWCYKKEQMEKECSK